MFTVTAVLGLSQITPLTVIVADTYLVVVALKLVMDA
jgi:hypothetical protein